MRKKLKRIFPVLLCMLLYVCIPMQKASAENVTVSAEDVDQTQSVFRVTMDQPDVSDMSQVLFAVWGEQDNQNDLQWYEAQRSGSGYQYDVRVSNHGETGRYAVHAYVKQSDGTMVFVGDTSFSVTEAPAGSTGNVSVNTSDYDESNGTFRAWVQGVQSSSGISQVQIPVWCADDQSDIKWYDAARMSDGSYMAEVSIANHGNHTGTYQIHAYVRENNGAFNIVGATTQQVSASTAGTTSTGNVTVTTTDYNASNGTFRAWVRGAQSSSGIRQVQIPVWCADDQSDIKWYDASRMSDGSYMAEVSIANHGNHTGTYQIHAYVRENNGAFNIVGATTQQVSGGNTNTSSNAELSVSDRDGSGAAYQVSLSGVQLTGLDSIQFAVWADQGGQDDLKWYKASRNSGGNYTYTVSISDHGQTGTYNVHAYALFTNGTLQILTGTTFQVDNAGASSDSAKVEVTNINENTGAFDIVVSGVSAPGGIQTVQVPVWHAEDQNDIKWYTARRQSSDTYTVSANISNHRNNTGKYNIHVYVTSNSGVMNCVCGTTADIKAGSSQQPVSSEVSATRISDSRYQVSVSAPQVSGSSAKVLFPTWSDANGQDDIIWYEGVRSGNGVWYVEVDSSRHGSSGSYTTHAYTQINGELAFVGAVNYSLEFVVQSRVANDANQIIGSITNGSMDSAEKLRTCYNWVVNNISYQTLPIPLEPSEPGYTQEEWYAIYGLEQRRGNCYCYAASFAAMARQLGYSASMISGSVPLLAGGKGPHAWVEIYMNGATYVCDPESQHENPAYGFYMTTYATAPYQYTK